MGTNLKQLDDKRLIQIVPKNSNIDPTLSITMSLGYPEKKTTKPNKGANIIKMQMSKPLFRIGRTCINTSNFIGFYKPHESQKNKMKVCVHSHHHANQMKDGEPVYANNHGALKALTCKSQQVGLLTGENIKVVIFTG